MGGITILNQAFPPPSPNRKNAVLALLSGLFIGSFLLFFQPFAIDRVSYTYPTLSLLGYGLITTLTLLVFLCLLPWLLPQLFLPTSWRLKHQLLFYFIILFVIALGNGLYTNAIFDLRFSWPNTWQMLWHTYSIGIILTALLLLYDYRSWPVNNTLSHPPTIANPGKKWQITTDLKETTFELHEADFMFATAEGNYVDLFSITDQGDLSKTTHRLTLASLEQQLATDFLRRCHRSYLINLRQVDDWVGNTQGLRLRLKNYQDPIPVSRKYAAEIRAWLVNHPRK
ncbi:MAG: LytTR family DNA-binding domain-containing protein [Bacteroidota bacterium]